MARPRRVARIQDGIGKYHAQQHPSIPRGCAIVVKSIEVERGLRRQTELPVDASRLGACPSHRLSTEKAYDCATILHVDSDHVSA